ncbi:MAG: TetR/AcrR family transcriptional regulator [Pseudonocardia sp.]|nr:TetR/AcrR family transcriptional regulator [Pseudonocardia sp.]
MVVERSGNGRREATRVRLTELALDLFARQGFEDTTAAEIAAAAGVTERTFFNHFTTKLDAIFPVVSTPPSRPCASSSPRPRPTSTTSTCCASSDCAGWPTTSPTPSGTTGPAGYDCRCRRRRQPFWACAPKHRNGSPTR